MTQSPSPWSVPEQQRLIDRLPRRLGERAWKVYESPNVERRHHEALLLLQESVLHLASLAFAAYRRSHLSDPNELVEQILLRYDQPWTRDYAELLRQSLAASSSPRLLETRKVSLRTAAQLARSVEVLGHAIHTSDRPTSLRVGPLLDHEFRQGGSQVLKWDAFLNLVVDYRNGVAHADRTKWTDVSDFYEQFAPLLESVAIEFLCSPEVHKALVRYPTSVLRAVAQASDGRCDQSFVVDAEGRDQRWVVTTNEPVTASWPDSRWSGEIGGRFLLDCGPEGDPENAEVLGPLHDFLSREPPPVPLRLPEATNRQMAIVGAMLMDTWSWARGERRSPTLSLRRVGRSARLDDRTVKRHMQELRPLLTPVNDDGRESEGETDLATALCLRSDLGYVLAVEFGHEDLGLAFGDLTGHLVHKPLHEHEEYLRAAHKPEAAVRYVAGLAERARIEAGIDDPRHIFATVVGVAAAVRSERPYDAQTPDTVLPQSGLPDSWDGFEPAAELQRVLADEYGWRVMATARNDANLAALAEVWWGCGRGSAALVYIEWSQGIGGGLVLQGQLHDGANGCAAEVGHFRLDASAAGPCSCGHLNCLEAFASTTAMVRDARLAEQGEGPADVAAFHERLEAGDPTCLSIAITASHRVGAALAPLVSMIDPDVVVLGGSGGEEARRFPVMRSALTMSMNERLPPGFASPRLEFSQHGEDAVLQGALTFGLSRFAAEHLVGLLGVTGSD
jgi:predicted NBD/HSP70 family sugar kinase